MSAYTIAAYFSEPARRAAVAETYCTRSAGSAPGTYRRDAHGRCPVGVLLHADGYSGYRCPDSATAASAIYRRVAGQRSKADANTLLKAIRTAVSAFNDAWDGGAIADLAAALDVPENTPAAEPTAGQIGVRARKPARIARVAS